MNAKIWKENRKLKAFVEKTMEKVMDFIDLYDNINLTEAKATLFGLIWSKNYGMNHIILEFDSLLVWEYVVRKEHPFKKDE